MINLNDLIPEERRAFRTKPRLITNILCPQCGKPMIETEFHGGYRLTCDNHACTLFRGCQGIRLKPKAPKLPGEFRDLEHYKNFLKQRSDNYYRLVGLGFTPKQANKLKSNKQTERLEQMVKKGLSVDYITNMLSGDGHG